MKLVPMLFDNRAAIEPQWHRTGPAALKRSESSTFNIAGFEKPEKGQAKSGPSLFAHAHGTELALAKWLFRNGEDTMLNPTQRSSRYGYLRSQRQGASESYFKNRRGPFALVMDGL